jgi:hypothetical protein
MIVLGFCSGAVDVTFLLECGTMPLGVWCPAFRDIIVVSSSRIEVFVKDRCSDLWR